MTPSPTNAAEPSNSNFIASFIQGDIDAGRVKEVRTRFPPEPNGWLHIGHCKALSIDFGMAAAFGGKCNLRFDDTNPEKESVEFVNAIKRDIKWLGYDWEEREYYASDYYDYLFDLALGLIKKGKAYVDDLTEEEMRKYRGTAVPDKNNITITPPGKDSPFRTRTIEENLDLFQRMKAGEFADGAKTLRAKIDMKHPNLVMRDPVMYRIRREAHYRTGGAWCIYPMYDFQHPLSDAKEGITHSLCSLEYEIHRPLYDWFIREAGVFPSRQIEFARLNITHTVLSKRHLLRLVQEKYVSGWDDPRMPTLAGLRRRGCTAEAVRAFMGKIGVAKVDSTVDIALLEHCLREDLNKKALRVMAVLDPLRLIIDNWEEGVTDSLDAVNNPEDEGAGSRAVNFSRELWIERSDFEETPPPKYFRLFPGNLVRLRYGYVVECTGCDKDAAGRVVAVHCKFDSETRGGNARDNQKVRGTIHWVNAADAVPLEIRIYDYLFPEDPAEGGKAFIDNINSASLQVIKTAYGEPCLASAIEGAPYQFERQGYFVRDRETGDDGRPVFNKTIGMRDTWGKILKNS